MPSRRPTVLGPVPAPREEDDEAPTRSGFGDTGDEERTAVDDRVVRSVVTSVPTAVDERWGARASEGSDGDASGTTSDYAGEVPTSDKSVDDEATADDIQTLDRPGRLRPRQRGTTGTSVDTVDEPLSRARERARKKKAARRNRKRAQNSKIRHADVSEPSTIVEDDDPQTLDGARPLPPLTVVPGGAAATTPVPVVNPEPLAALVAIGGNDLGRRFPVAGTVVTVGRAVNNDVVLTDISVSRHHLTIVYDGRRYLMRDLSSGNGTLVNNRAEDRAELTSGDQLELGNTLLRFESEVDRAGIDPRAFDLDEQSTVAQRPGGPRALPLASPERADAPAPVPHVSAAAVARADDGDRGDDSDRGAAKDPFAGGVVNTVATYPVARHPRDAPATAAVVPVPADLAYARTDDRGRRHVYVFAVAVGLVLALVVFAGGGGSDDDATVAESSRGAANAGETQAAAAPVEVDETPRRVAGGSAADSAARNDGVEANVEPARAVGNDEDVRSGDDDAATDDASDDARDGADPGGDGELAIATAADDDDPDDDAADDDAADDDEPDGSAASGEDDRAIARTKTARKAAPSNRRGRADRKRAARTPPPARRATPRRDNAALARAADLYKARQFAAAAGALRSSADSASATDAKKLRARASSYESVGKFLATGDAQKRTNAPGAMAAYRKALSLDRNAGRGVHGTYIRLRLRDVAPRAAGAFMAQKRYEAARRATDEAVTYGAGADPMVTRVRAALSRKASELYKAGLASRAKNPRLADANFKRVLNMVGKDDPLHAKARAALDK